MEIYVKNEFINNLNYEIHLYDYANSYFNNMKKKNVINQIDYIQYNYFYQTYKTINI